MPTYITINSDGQEIVDAVNAALVAAQNMVTQATIDGLHADITNLQTQITNNTQLNNESAVAMAIALG